MIRSRKDIVNIVDSFFNGPKYLNKTGHYGLAMECGCKSIGTALHISFISAPDGGHNNHASEISDRWS